jgi:hypothetical protein
VKTAGKFRGTRNKFRHRNYVRRKQISGREARASFDMQMRAFAIALDQGRFAATSLDIRK